MVESTSDLVANLTESAKRPPSLQLNQDTLKRLEQEKQRLHRELEYLEAEEEKLTQQDAPISLVERAIEPTQHRLAKVESTLQKALDLSFNLLTPPQIAILRSLVSASGARVIRRSLKGDEADLETLEEMALITTRQDGVVMIHDLVAACVLERYGTA